jgi:HK97 family phage portal protein
LILEENMKFSKSTVPPNEAQFLESRQFGLEDVARIFRIPPHKIQHLLRSTFTNIEQQSLEYVTDTLMPWFVRWELEIQRKLFVRADGTHNLDLFAEHLVEGLLRGDMKTRSEFMWRLFQMGALSPDDIRAFNNQNPLPNGQGEGYYLLGNMVPLGENGILENRPQQRSQGRPQQVVTQPIEQVLPEGASNGHTVNVG